MSTLVPPITAPPLIPNLPSIPNPFAPNPFNLGALGNHVAPIASGGGTAAAAGTASGLSLSAPVASNPVGATAGLSAAALGAGLLIGNGLYEGLGRPFGPSLGDRARGLFGDPANGAVPQRAGPGAANIQPGKPPFQGGQMEAVRYRISYSRVSDDGQKLAGTFSGYYLLPILGPISGVSFIPAVDSDVGESRNAHLKVSHGGGTFEFSLGTTKDGGKNYGNSFHWQSIEDISVERIDGLPDTGGDPPALPISTPWPAPAIPIGAKSAPFGGTLTASPPLAHAPTAPAPTAPAGVAGGDLNPAVPGESATPAIPGQDGFAPAIPQAPTIPGLGIPAIPGLGIPVAGAVGVGGAAAPTKEQPKEREATKPKKQCPCNGGLLSLFSNLLKSNAAALGNSAQLGVMQGQLTGIQTTATANNAGIAVNTGKLTALTNLVTAVSTVVNTINNLTRKTWDLLQIDRFLAVANFVTSLHNAYFLSRELGETIGWAVDSVFQVIGIDLKDADDNPISVTGLIDEYINKAIDAVVPAETQAVIKARLDESNRIYQAAMNLYGAVHQLFDTGQAIMEVVGQYVGKIGNALKRSGSIMEDSFGWMTENFDSIHQTTSRWEKFENAVSNAEQVVSDVGAVANGIQDVKTTTEEITQSRQELNDAIRAADQVPEAAELSSAVITSDELEDKLNSEAPVSIEVDSFNPAIAGRPD